MAILAALLVFALAAPSQSRGADVLDYACAPPVPAAAENCAAWHTSPVTLNWIFGSSLLPVPGANCGSRVIDFDTAGTDVTCSVTSLLTGVLTKTATVRVDMTPPAVNGAVPDRPPDHDGWWNHPVAFSFGGSDATSGIANCDTVPYAGPDSASAQVRGGCRDVAGNAATGASPLKYDATPPTVTPLPQAPSGADHVTLKWSASPDTVQCTVERSPGRDGTPSSTVYSGPSQTFTDFAVARSTVYTYTISVSDAAANSSSTVIVAMPGGSQQAVLGTRQTGPSRPSPRRRAILPRLRWRRIRGADYYNVQVFRGRRKILSAWPAGTRLQLRERWTFKGRHFRLRPGRYHWYAWPGFGSRRAHRYGRMICHRRFTIPKPT